MDKNFKLFFHGQTVERLHVDSIENNAILLGVLVQDDTKGSSGEHLVAVENLSSLISPFIPAKWLSEHLTESFVGIIQTLLNIYSEVMTNPNNQRMMIAYENTRHDFSRLVIEEYHKTKSKEESKHFANSANISESSDGWMEIMDELQKEMEKLDPNGDMLKKLNEDFKKEE